MERPGWIVISIWLALGPWWAQAGGGPWNTLVVVNDNSPVSQELGQYYQDLRGLPERNIAHVRATTNYTTTLADFTNDVVNPVLAYIASAGLSNQIDYIVLTRDLPYRVGFGAGFNGSSAVFFHGFFTNVNPFVSGCSLPTQTYSDYYQAEVAFAHAAAPSSNRYRLSSVITGTTLDQARRTLDRSRAADASCPTGRIVFLHTTDNDRAVRWPQFDDAVFAALVQSNPAVAEVVDSNGLSSVSNLAGYLTGVANEPFMSTLEFSPGALADHLTSYGGYLLDPNGQTSILDWLRQGAAGSYGAVVEPCNYTEKFPDARLHVWYGRGFNLGESYAMSVRSPFEGVMVGDPLTAPHAVPPRVVVTGLLAGAVVTGDVALVVSASTGSRAGRMSQLDVLLDGVWLGSVTSVPPASGNTVEVDIGGTVRSATVQAGDSLAVVAGRLADAITNSPFGYRARAYGDRVAVVRQTLGTSGAWLRVSGSSSTGSADRLTVFAHSYFTNFMESPVAAKEGLLLSGAPVSGDVVRVVLTRLDGAVVTNDAMAVTGDTDATLMVKLQNSINSNPNFNLAEGCEARWPTQVTGEKELWLVARTNSWPGCNLFVSYSILTNPGSTLNTAFAFTDNFNDNAEALGARAAVFLTEGETNLQAAWTLAVTDLPDGPHEVTLVAYEGSAVRTQGRLTIPFVVDRHSMTCAITNLVSGRYLWRGGAVTAEVAAASPGVVTQVALWVEGKLAAVTSEEPYRLAWATTNYGAGLLGVQAQAWDDAGRSTLSERLEVNLVADEDGDTLPDQWEYRWLGGMTNGAAGDDPDHDGQDNRSEFLAFSDPRDVASGLFISAFMPGQPLVLELPVNTHRTYRVEVNGDALRDAPWSEAAQLSPSTNGTISWADAPTNALLFYRVRAFLP